ncbi:class D sortase [Paenisporosarcina sp. TG20]|uniref:class D sortase n=1 Tax=Paenisporosarcina sp. TG20 TaxID=1211706 RepID=UPI0003826DC7|nr:class D sortase [Paenisporosarcina sp. TG20]
MNRKRPSIRKFKGFHLLSLGLLILGISFIIWSSFEIYGNKVSMSAPIIPIKEQLETVNLPSISNEVGEKKILYPIRPTVGEDIGSLTIPALNQTIPIFHGTDEDELKRGIGHFAQSVLPGENDNSVLSGHRDTVFRKLGQLKLQDQLIVKTSAGVFTYEIKEIKIVDQYDKTIITPTDDAVLTVTTCYPFDFIGSAPDRYILIADLINSEIF